MIESQDDVTCRRKHGGSSSERNRLRPHLQAKIRVLVVENERALSEPLGQLLEDRGYEVSCADDGRAALKLLNAETVPDLIILDLNMPVMDGWEFRTIQKDDPKLGLIPVLAISADSSPKAAAISAQGYLRKPFDSQEMMTAVERVLAENQERIAERQDETERLASLGRVAANVGHEINNPLAFVTLNLRQSLDELRATSRKLGTGGTLSEVEVVTLNNGLIGIAEMLAECQIGSERIRATVTNLQQLSHRPVTQYTQFDLRKVLDESAAMAANQIRHRARLTKAYGDSVLVRGNRAALGQVFLNLLINAAQSIPEGEAERNDIQITTENGEVMDGTEVMVEIRDSGSGIASDVVARVFEPYFTTKALGEGTGLGLSISRQTVTDHGGRITVESDVGTGTAFRVFLPIDRTPTPKRSSDEMPSNLRRGRVLVVDDEVPIGRILRSALKNEHEVIVALNAADALSILERDQTFDVVLCDLVMPDISGPDFYARVKERWPRVAARVVFMTGGACTPRTVEFMKCVPTSILSKPFALDEVRRVVREYLRDDLSGEK